MSPGQRENNAEVEEIDLEEIPRIGMPIIGIFLIYAAVSVGLNDMMLNLVVGGAGAALIVLFAVLVGKKYQEGGLERALNYAITAPVDNQNDKIISKDSSPGIEKTEKGVTLDHLKEIDPYEFEEFVAKVWRARGYDAEVTQGSQDRGVDVVAEKAEPYNEKELIQVKRKGDGQKVGAPTVRTCSGLKNKNGVDKVLVVTSTGFTSQAKEEAEDYNLKLVDGKKLLELYEENIE